MLNEMFIIYLLTMWKWKKHLRGDITQIFITYAKPYRLASKDTLGRWLPESMQTAGIDIRKYTAYIARSAAALVAQS